MMNAHSIRLLIFTIGLAAFAAQAQKQIVVDNVEATFEGGWTNGAAAADKFGSDYRFAYCIAANQSPATATFRPRIPTAGKYHVEISYPRGANRSTNALWSISGASGLITTKINQKLNGGEWVRIASSIDFAAGDKGFIKVANNTGEAETTSVGQPVVVADAVRLIPTTNDEAANSTANVGAAIEVDDRQVMLEGSWAEITPSKSKRGKLQHYAMTKGTTTATAIFRPDLPRAGKYDVEIFFLEGKNRSDAIPWTLVGADGETTGFLDQSQNGERWFRLVSAKSFAAGTDGFLELRNGTGKTNYIVVADAVRFVPIESASAAPQSTAQTTPAASTAPSPARPGQTFTLSIQTVGGGKVTRSSDQIRYPANASVTLTAVPDEGFVFGGWTGDVNRMLNPLPLTMVSDVKLTANFWAAGIGVIMDNSDAEFTGSWSTPEKAWGNPKYDTYDYSSAVEGSETASATYHPVIPRGGLYDVYIWYPAGPNRAQSAPWEIVHKGGSVTVTVNQKENGAQWNLLAAGVEFEPGKKGRVRLTNKAAPLPSVVVADAVAFVYVGAPQ